MRRELCQLAVVIAMCVPQKAAGIEERETERKEGAAEALPELGESASAGASAVLGIGLGPAGLIGAGIAAAAALAGGGGSKGGESTASGGSGGGSGGSAQTRNLAFTSATDFRTSEYTAQPGLAAVRADTLYFNGHYRWYMGEASHPAAGSGIGVKIAVGDTGINAPEAGSGSAIAIDAAASYDYIAGRAGSGADEFGHGTHVAGIIAAPRNGAGMHGLAYNATIVNFKLGDASGLITATDAQRADMMARAANAGALILNNSWASSGSITSFTAANLQGFMPRMIEASRAYVARGGVVVFAAGNEAAAHPSLEAGLPHRISGIQPGWLAVVAIDGSGLIASYSNRCGVAATWCLAAPGGGASAGLYSMYNNGGYASLYGTSMAAPHAAAAIGALKSMFPNLSYLQLRDRLLFTADRTGSYADASVYGQGLMDLAAASSPVGGVALPTGTAATGATAPVSESAIQLPAAALRGLGLQRVVLVVDNYQRAPFWVPAQAFFREVQPRLLDRQWASLRSPLRMPARGRGTLAYNRLHGLHDVVSIDLATHRFGFFSGVGGEHALASHLDLAWRPQLAAPAVDALGLGYASDFGGTRIGLLGALPSSAYTAEGTLDSSPLGKRRALGLIAQRRAGPLTYGASLAVADHFERPVGIASHGAFAVGGRPAFSSGLFMEHAADRRAAFTASLEIARYRPEGTEILAAPAYAMRSGAVGARLALGEKTNAAVTFKRDWSGGEAARLYLPLSIAESGEIGRAAYALPYDELVGRRAVSLVLEHAPAKGVALRGGVTRERTGFGTLTGVAAIMEMEM
jgi:hypothetical protein